MIKHIYDKFAEKWYHGGRVFIISDTHFRDLDCYKLRFPDLFKPEVKDMINKLYGEEKASSFELDVVNMLDKMQIDNINKVCNKADTLIILGDICDIDCIKKLKAGYKVLVMGNHDKGTSNYKKTLAEPKLFDEVYEGPLFISEKILLSHEPIELPFGLNIHGHVHNKSYVSKGLNVCAEVIDYKPICLDEFIKAGKLKDIKSIHRITIDIATERKQKRTKGARHGK